MKKIMLFLAVFSLFAGLSYADEPIVSIPTTIELKQGMLINWADPTAELKNLTTVTIAETEPLESFGKWNVLWDGWTLDLGLGYDGSGVDTAALLVGRKFGNLGNYLPINFPLKDKLNLTIYPFGIEGDDIFERPSFRGASGMGFVKFDLSF